MRYLICIAALLSITLLSACHAGVNGTLTPPIAASNATAPARLSSGASTNIVFSGFAPAAYITVHDGSAYVTDIGNHALKKIAPDGTVTTVSADLPNPSGVAVDATGTPYVGSKRSVFRITPSGRKRIFTADSGGWYPRGMAFDGQGNLYVVTGQPKIRKIAPDGTVTLVGNSFYDPSDVAIARSGAIYIAEPGDSTLKVLVHGKIYKVTQRPPGFQYIEPTTVDVDPSGNVYVTDANSNALIKIVPHVSASVVGYFSGIGDVAVSNQSVPFVTCVGGVYKVTSSGARSIAYGAPTAVGTDPNGNVYTANLNAYRIAPNGLITEIASQSQLGPYYIYGIAGDAMGNVYIANNRGTVYKALPNGQVTTFASVGSAAQIAIDQSSNLYVTDTASNKVYKYAPNGSLLKEWGSVSPFGVAVDTDDDVYFTEYNRIIKVSRYGRSVVGGGFKGVGGIAVSSSGTLYVSDFAANAVYKVLGKDRNETVSSGFRNPYSVATDTSGNLLVADYGHGKIKELTFSSR